MPIEININSGLIIKPTPSNNLRSEPMQELLTREPSFLGKWAFLIFAVILLLLLAGTWLIQYPETIKATATLAGTNAPKEIIVKQDGRLVKLLVANSDIVKEGAIIGWIESNASHKQVLALAEKIDMALLLANKGNTPNIKQLFIEQFSNLGELQGNYQQFITAYQTFTDYLATGFYPKKKAALQTDIIWLQKTNNNLIEQKKLLLHDLQLTEDGYKANESLYKDKVISKQDYRNEESKFVCKQLSIPQLEASLLNNETQQRDKQKEITELEHGIAQQKLVFQQALQTLQSQISDWKKKYLFQAPTTGKLVFTIPLQQNQFLKNGRLLGYVNPIVTSFYAEVNLPQNNFGKIAVGQQVQLRLAAYPYNEFGFVKGKLEYISNIASDSGFIARIQLPEGLTTNQHKVLQYSNGLKADALIITKDRRLLESFYSNIIKVTNQ